MCSFYPYLVNIQVLQFCCAGSLKVNCVLSFKWISLLKYICVLCLTSDLSHQAPVSRAVYDLSNGPAEGRLLVAAHLLPELSASGRWWWYTVCHQRHEQELLPQSQEQTTRCQQEKTAWGFVCSILIISLIIISTELKLTFPFIVFSICPSLRGE